MNQQLPYIDDNIAFVNYLTLGTLTIIGYLATYHAWLGGKILELEGKVGVWLKECEGPATGHKSGGQLYKSL